MFNSEPDSIPSPRKTFVSPLRDGQLPDVELLPEEANVLGNEMARLQALGRQIWSIHSRKCRRYMEKKLKLAPEMLSAHMAACTCGWPAARLEAYQKAWAKEQEVQGEG